MTVAASIAGEVRLARLILKAEGRARVHAIGSRAHDALTAWGRLAGIYSAAEELLELRTSELRLAVDDVLSELPGRPATFAEGRAWDESATAGILSAIRRLAGEELEA